MEPLLSSVTPMLSHSKSYQEQKKRSRQKPSLKSRSRLTGEKGKEEEEEEEEGVSVLGRGREGRVWYRPGGQEQDLAYKEVVTKNGPLKYSLIKQLVGLSLPPHSDLMRMRDLSIVPIVSSVSMKSGESSSSTRTTITLPRAPFGTLKEYMDKRVFETFSLVQIAGIFYQLFCALDALHSNGLIHYDVKPGNVFLYTLPGKDEKKEIPEIKLGDFGLLHFVHAPTFREPNTLSTKGYRAPEQMCLDSKALGRGYKYRLDPKADIYSAGVMLLEMLEMWLTDQQTKPRFSSDDDNHVRRLALDLARTMNVSKQTWQRYCGFLDRQLEEQELSKVPPPVKGRERNPFVILKSPSSSPSQSRKSRERSKTALFQELLQLASECVAFDPRDRPSAKLMVQALGTLMLDVGHVSLPECPDYLVPEFQILLQKGKDQTEEKEVGDLTLAELLPFAGANPRLSRKELVRQQRVARALPEAVSRMTMTQPDIGAIALGAFIPRNHKVKLSDLVQSVHGPVQNQELVSFFKGLVDSPFIQEQSKRRKVSHFD